MPRHRHRAIKESTRRYYKCLNLLELVKLFVPQQQMYKAKACAQRMCPMKSTCWPYPNEYCEMLTISNGYLRARQRTHGTMALRMALGHTWTWLHDEYLNCMKANLITVMLLKCPNDALFTGTWNMLTKEVVHVLRAPHASLSFDNWHRRDQHWLAWHWKQSCSFSMEQETRNHGDLLRKLVMMDG